MNKNSKLTRKNRENSPNCFMDKASLDQIREIKMRIKHHFKKYSKIDQTFVTRLICM